MTLTKKPFPAVCNQLATSAGILYTCPANTQAVINKLSFVNSTGTNRTVTVYIVRSGFSPTAVNLVCYLSPVLLNASASCPEIEGLVLAPGDTVQALADAATAVSPAGSVTEYAAS